MVASELLRAALMLLHALAAAAWFGVSASLRGPTYELL